MDAYAAHADAATVEGTLRGGAATLPGIRVSSSGLPEPQWNTADVTAPDADVAAARAFFEDLPFGLRVPYEFPWDIGRRLFRQPLMALGAGALVPPAGVPGLTIRAAGTADLDAVLAVDAAAFESEVEAGRPWAAPHLGA